MTSTVPAHPARDARQRALVPPDRLARCHAVVVGVGALGRPVALLLAAAGAPMMTLYDPAPVAESDLGSAGYWADDVGARKVDATTNGCHQRFPLLDLTAVPGRLGRSAPRGWPADRDTAVFCCVGAAADRWRVWPAVRGVAAFIADGQVAGEVIRVLAADRPPAGAAYPVASLTDKAYGISRATPVAVYAAAVAAGLMSGSSRGGCMVAR